MTDQQVVTFVVGMATGATVQALVVIAWMWIHREKDFPRVGMPARTGPSPYRKGRTESHP